MSSTIGLARIWLCLLIIVAAAAIHLHEPLWLSHLRDPVFDTYQRIRPRTYQPAPVRVIDIDEESLRRIGQWPWPRTRVAELVATLHRLGAAVIAFDVLFAEPDRTSPARVLPEWGDQPALRMLMEELPDNDERLRDAVASANVVTAFALAAVGGVRVPQLKAGYAIAGTDPGPFVPAFETAVTTLEMIESVARGNGAINVIRDLDGVGRQVPLVLRLGNSLYPSLAAEALRVAQGATTFVIKTAGASGETNFGAATGITSVRIGAFTVPTDAHGQVSIYFTPSVPERSIPAWKVLAGEVDPESIEGQILLIGTSATGLHDLHATPLGVQMPGVMLHAQFIEQVIHGVHLVRPDWAKGAEVLLMVGLGILIIVIGPWVGALWMAVICAITLALAFAWSWFAFADHGMLFNPLVPAMIVVAVYLTSSLLRHMQTEREQRWIRSAFSTYVSPNLVEELVKNPALLSLGGERKEMTFVFTDLEGFTSLVERSAPDVIVPLLNEYLDAMERIAFKHDGTIDKIVGDALHVIFGAPVTRHDHAQRAVDCALEMDAFGQAFSQRKRAEGIPFGMTRIGVNSGPAVVGNFGGFLRFDYTAHGDAINTAARLESANKFFGTRVCVSGSTAQLCERFAGRPIGALVLKGKTEAIETFEPLVDDLLHAPQTEAYLHAYQLLEAGNEQALAAFEAVCQDDPDDALAAFHLNRLKQGESGTRIVMAGK
ncbi:MAG: adenylate/guanylate cyclase domain-containing protein [Defluviicoccus sp.]|nr:adenylate/guanylate cyclase domain-containing protein [Defluviicoccus sp.]MDG4610347.1 adenylate/guanylate cyclase domain-containing protein [Defluviicoccus sp.]